MNLHDRLSPGCTFLGHSVVGGKKKSRKIESAPQRPKGTRPVFLRPWYEVRVTIKIYQSALEASQTAILSFFGKKCCQWISPGKILQDTPGFSVQIINPSSPAKKKHVFSYSHHPFLQQNMI